MFSTPDAKRLRRSSTGIRRSIGPASSRHGTPTAAARNATPRAASIAQSGIDVSPVSSIRRGKSSYALASQEEAESRVLVRNEALTVDIWAELPAEVQEYITNTDLYTNAFRSGVGHDVGYAFLVGKEKCWVWSVARRHHISTAFTFACPKAESSSPATFFAPTPYAVLLPTAKGREPTLVLVGPRGEIRLWQAISMGLSGSRYASASLSLMAEEVIKDVLVVNKNVLLVSTSASRIFRILLQSAGGQTSMRVVPQALDLRGGTGVWRFLPTWGASGVVTATDGIFSMRRARALDAAGRVLLWALEKNTLSLIETGSASGEKLRAQNVGLVSLVAPFLADTAGENIQVLALDCAANGDIALLVTAPQQSGRSAAGTVHEYFLFALKSNADTLEVANTNLDLSVTASRRLGYSAIPDLRPLSHPHVKLLSGGPLVLIQFADVLVFTSMLTRSTLDEIVPLKATAGETRNRFFGADEVTSSPLSLECAAISAASGILRVRLTEAAKAQDTQEVDGMEMVSVADAQSRSRMSTATGTASNSRQTSKLKARLEQAVFFGEEQANPLAFDAAIDDSGADVGKAALEVSEGILQSSSDHLQHIIDMRAQLAARASRLQALAVVLHERGLYGKISQSARRQLMWNAERLAGAAALWSVHNATLSTPAGSGDLLVSAAEELLSATGGFSSQDAVRDVLREHVASLDHLLHLCTTLTRANIKTSPRSTIEAARLVITTYKAVEHFRSDANNIGLYGIDDAQLAFEPWTSRASSVEDQLWLFDALRNQWQSASRDVSQSAVSESLKEELDGLADHTLEIMRERIAYLAAQKKNAADLRALRERFDNVRPAVIRVLVDIGKPGRAFEVAERFLDYRSLVELATDVTSGSEQQVQLYIEKYGESFAFPLYNYFVEKGQSRMLLTQPDVYGGLVQAYLQQADLPRFSWMHDIVLRRFDEAAKTLLETGPKASTIAEQHSMLSIAKLAYLATIPEKELIDAAEVGKTREVFDDRLDFTISQLDMQGYTLQILESEQVPLAASLDTKAMRVTSVLTQKLDDRPALKALYQSFTSRLLRGVALSPEDMLDLYTLTDPDAQATRFIQALQLLLRYQTILPRARAEMAMESIWRRIYLATPWAELQQRSAGASDEEIAAALQRTSLHKVLAFAAQEGHRTYYEVLIRPPSQALFGAMRETFDARFGSTSTQENESLWSEYEYESSMVTEAIEQSNLERWYGEVVRLVSWAA